MTNCGSGTRSRARRCSRASRRTAGRACTAPRSTRWSPPDASDDARLAFHADAAGDRAARPEARRAGRTRRRRAVVAPRGSGTARAGRPALGATCPPGNAPRSWTSSLPNWHWSSAGTTPPRRCSAAVRLWRAAEDPLREGAAPRDTVVVGACDGCVAVRNRSRPAAARGACSSRSGRPRNSASCTRAAPMPRAAPTSRITSDAARDRHEFDLARAAGSGALNGTRLSRGVPSRRLRNAAAGGARTGARTDLRQFAGLSSPTWPSTSARTSVSSTPSRSSAEARLCVLRGARRPRRSAIARAARLHGLGLRWKLSMQCDEAVAQCARGARLRGPRR